MQYQLEPAEESSYKFTAQLPDGFQFVSFAYNDRSDIYWVCGHVPNYTDELVPANFLIIKSGDQLPEENYYRQQTIYANHGFVSIYLPQSKKSNY